MMMKNVTKVSPDFNKRLIRGKIDQLNDLPAPNAHIMQVIRLLRQEEVDITELITAIEADQTLVAKILKIINAGYYSFKNQIDSVERAVCLLGILKIKEIVYAASIMDLFTDEDKKEWEHAYTSSALMTAILKNNEIPVAISLPITTLMHDIGKVVLRRCNPQKYRMAMQLMESKKISNHAAETEILQITHAEAGAYLLQKWDMSEDIYMPVACHHDQEPPANYVVETALLQIVDWVDARARDFDHAKPSKSIMTAAGFDAIDWQSYVTFQRQQIRELKGKF